jgi:flagellar hook-associated protein 1 FlgK
MATGLLGIALSGLNAAQAGITTAQHNISNINTAGFRRQEVDFKAQTLNHQGSNSFGVTTGASSGVGVGSVRSLYSQFQDSQVLLSQAQLSRNETYATHASQLDNLLGDANSGLSTAMDAFFSAAQTVASDPTSNAARQSMLSSGRNLVSRINTLDTAFKSIQSDSNREVDAAVSQINSYTRQIADLNGSVAAAEASTGQSANDLRDQRDQLISELNKLINVTPVQQSDGAFNLFVGSGQQLVVGSSVTPLVSGADASNPGFRVPVLSLPGGATVALDASILTGGELGGLLAMREDVLIPAMEDLDTLAYEFSTQFNVIHLQGFDKTGAGNMHFFTDLTTLATPPTNAAGAFSLSVDLNDPLTNRPDPNRIAASSTSAGSPGDNANGLLLARLQFATAVNGTDSFDSFYGRIVARTATLASEADINVSAYEALTSQAKQAQQAISGVSLDEEAANLIRFQQAYQASAKAMQVASGLFDQLIGIMN